jgi:hypothetical protein
MFYSYKNFPITIQSYSATGAKNSSFADYSFVAQNIGLNIETNADFAFPINEKKPYRGFNKQGLTSTIQIDFISQVPYDKIFFNNIFLESGIKHNFKINCGDSVFVSGYLKSFSSSVNPNNLVQNQAQFIFFSTGSGLNGFTGSNGTTSYPVNSDSNSFYAHGANTLIAFNDTYNEYSKHEVQKVDFTYNANIQPIYDIDTIYPSRVVFNKEEVELNIELDSYGLGIRNINNIIDGTKIVYTGSQGSSNGIELYLRSGYLINKTFNAKINDIINSRISLKYFI